MAVHQAIEDASPRRFSDRGGNSRDTSVGLIRIHSLMIDEVLMLGNPDTRLHAIDDAGHEPDEQT